MIMLMLAPMLLSWDHAGEGKSPGSGMSKTCYPENRITHLEMIRQNGELKVVTEYNSISYFLYRGQALGFQYELLQRLANHMDLALDVSVSNDL